MAIMMVNDGFPVMNHSSTTTNHPASQKCPVKILSNDDGETSEPPSRCDFRSGQIQGRKGTGDASKWGWVKTLVPLVNPKSIAGIYGCSSH